MKKHLFPLFIAFIATIGLSSCEEIEILGTFTGYDNAALKQECSSDASSALSITFTSDCDWAAVVELYTAETIGTKNHWLTLDKASGAKGESTITFALTENGTGVERYANIKITCGTEGVLSVSVKQKAEVIVLEKDFSKYDEKELIKTFIYNEGIKSVFTFTAKSAWTVESDKAWLTLNKADGVSPDITYTVIEGGVAGVSEFHIGMTKNETTEDRIATVLLTCGETTLTFKYTQKFDPYELMTFTLYDPIMQTQSFTFDSAITSSFGFNSKDAWTAVSDSSWATLDIKAGEAGNGRIVITLEQNATGVERVAVVKILSRGDELPITITQAKLGDFNDYLIANFDKDKNGEVSDAEALLITEVNCSGHGLTSLDGIERLTKLFRLDCSDNNLTEFPTDKLITLFDLVEVICFGNDEIVELDVRTVRGLRILDASPMASLLTLLVQPFHSIENVIGYKDNGAGGKELIVRNHDFIDDKVLIKVRPLQLPVQ